MIDRDPLTNPRPGDVIRLAGFTVTVTEVMKRHIDYHYTGKGQRLRPEWEEWCRRNHAVVVKQAESEAIARTCAARKSMGRKSRPTRSTD